MKRKFLYLDWLLTHIFIYIPLAVLTILSVGYIYILITSPASVERLGILIGLDTVIATTAGLSLYASYTTKDEKRKISYYESGELLFHAFIFTFTATFLRSSIFLLDDFPWFDAVKPPIQFILTISTVFFFTSGIVKLVFGLRNLLSFMATVTKER